MSSSPDRAKHCFQSLVRDLRKSIKRHTIFLSCDEDCCCGGTYNGLRMFYYIPRNILVYWWNPCNWLDKALNAESRMQQLLFKLDPKLQQQYESFLFDRRFHSAGLCDDCGKGRFTYESNVVMTCNYCGISWLRYQGTR